MIFNDFFVDAAAHPFDRSARGKFNNHTNAEKNGRRKNGPRDFLSPGSGHKKQPMDDINVPLGSISGYDVSPND